MHISARQMTLESLFDVATSFYFVTVLIVVGERCQHFDDRKSISLTLDMVIRKVSCSIEAG